MEPIITSTTSAEVFHIEFGPDPRILPVSAGQLAIAPDVVEVKISQAETDKRARSRLTSILGRIVFVCFPIWFVLGALLSAYTNQYLWFYSPLLLIILPAAISPFFVRFPRMISLPKDAIQAVRREGRTMTLLFQGDVHSLHGISFLAPTFGDALAIEQALAEATGTLPSPIRFPGVVKPVGNRAYFGFSSLNEVLITAERSSVTTPADA